MNIFLSSSGYNLFWQTGIMKALSANEDFWSRVNNIYAISGGAIACIYNYHLPPPEDGLMFEAFCHWWESFNRRRDTKSMKYIYTNGYKWIDKWNYTQDIFYDDLKTKKYFFGISHWNRFKLPLNFEWHEANMGSFKDRTRKCMLSGYAPFFIAKPDRRWLKKGVDGFFAYRHKNNYPLYEGKTLEIMANKLPPSGKTKHTIIQNWEDVHQLWNKRLTKTKVKKMYLKGMKDGENFLKNYLPTIS